MSDARLVDPRNAFPKPPFNDQPMIDLPAATAEMNPRPDHGEKTYKGSGKLAGLSALITGGDSGIGRAVALAYAREGADVVIVYKESHDDARETAAIDEETGRKAVALSGDLCEEKFCKSAVYCAINDFGRLDIVVNNAAYQQTAESIEEITTEDFDRVFKTNVYATFWICREAIPRMSPGGSVINTVSIQAYTPSPELLPYATTKTALIGMTKALAELAINYGIRVNAVAPGPVWTPLIPSTVSEEKTRHFGENTLFNRPAQPAELAPLYVWLASPEASYITAEVYGATGGRTPV